MGKLDLHGINEDLYICVCVCVCVILLPFRLLFSIFLYVVLAILVISIL